MSLLFPDCGNLFLFSFLSSYIHSAVQKFDSAISAFDCAAQYLSNKMDEKKENGFIAERVQMLPKCEEEV